MSSLFGHGFVPLTRVGNSYVFINMFYLILHNVTDSDNHLKFEIIINYFTSSDFFSSSTCVYYAYVCVCDIIISYTYINRVIYSI